MENNVCCICSKDEPFENDINAHCDEKNCSTTVHKACYDAQRLINVSWFCQKCLSRQKVTQECCKLCPSNEGVLNRTNTGGWCHVVCALFVPGVKFLDKGSFENVSLDNVSSDSFNKVCSICAENNRLDCATIGVCIQCRKTDCEVLFHVTCGQAQGLLQEVGSPKDGIQYLAYCFIHKQKSKRRKFIMPAPKNDIKRVKNVTFKPVEHKVEESCSLIEVRSNPSKDLNVSSSSGFISLDELSVREILSNIEVKDEEVEQKVDDIQDESQKMESIDNLILPVICSEMERDTENVQTSNQIMKTEQDKNVESPICTDKTGGDEKVDDSRNSNALSEISSNQIMKTEEVMNIESPICTDKAGGDEKVDDSRNTNALSQISDVSNKTSKRISKRRSLLTPYDTLQKKPKATKSGQKARCNTEPIKTTEKIEKVKRKRKVSTNTKDDMENKYRKMKVLPPIPKAIIDQVSNTILGTDNTLKSSNALNSPVIHTTENCNTACQSMEELLEWQWNQTGSLLMKQSDSDDIASLLSCLHDIKNENEQLLSKQLKLVRRRDNLKLVNSKLQIQILKTSVPRFPATLPDGSNVTYNSHSKSQIPALNNALSQNNLYKSSMTPTMIQPIQTVHNQLPYQHNIGQSFNSLIMAEPPQAGHSQVSFQQNLDQSSNTPQSIHNQLLFQHNLDQSSNTPQSIHNQLLFHHNLESSSNTSPMTQPSQSRQQNLTRQMSLSSGLSMPSQDLATYFNNQVNVQMIASNNGTPTSILRKLPPQINKQNLIISSGNEMNTPYHVIRPPPTYQQFKYQPQKLHASTLFDQTASTLSAQSGTDMNYNCGMFINHDNQTTKQ